MELIKELMLVAGLLGGAILLLLLTIFAMVKRSRP